MHTKTKRIVLSMMMVVLSGCAAIGVEVPQAQQTITTKDLFKVNVHRDADPNTVRIKLDGDDITNLFGPISAGATLTATPPAFPVGRRHEFDASAQFVGGPRPFGITHVAVEFNALYFTLEPVVGGGDCDGHCMLRMHEGETVSMQVSLPEAPYGDLPVTISTDNRNLSLGDQNAGDPLVVTIPGNDRHAVFTIKAISRGVTRVKAMARATNPDQYVVDVQ